MAINSKWINRETLDTCQALMTKPKIQTNQTGPWLDTNPMRLDWFMPLTHAGSLQQAKDKKLRMWRRNRSGSSQYNDLDIVIRLCSDRHEPRSNDRRKTNKQEKIGSDSQSGSWTFWLPCWFYKLYVIMFRKYDKQWTFNSIFCWNNTIWMLFNFLF